MAKSRDSNPQKTKRGGKKEYIPIFVSILLLLRWRVCEPNRNNREQWRPSFTHGARNFRNFCEILPSSSSARECPFPDNNHNRPRALSKTNKRPLFAIARNIAFCQCVQEFISGKIHGRQSFYFTRDMDCTSVDYYLHTYHDLQIGFLYLHRNRDYYLEKKECLERAKDHVLWIAYNTSMDGWVTHVSSPFVRNCIWIIDPFVLIWSQVSFFLF